FWAMESRQICWAHLIRKFASFAGHRGRAGEIGSLLLVCCRTGTRSATARRLVPSSASSQATSARSSRSDCGNRFAATVLPYLTHAVQAALPPRPWPQK
ncbi:MAG: hypothetical protein KC464_34960, partial [Myxococcales bacterium]|nr:hypothetical protein [Myxococcales bacterium]